MSEQKDVIKISTTSWKNGRGELVIQRTIRQMRSLSSSPRRYRAFENELSVCGAGLEDLSDSLPGIENLPDGLYEMFVKYQSYDCETGSVDGVEFGFEPVGDAK